LDTPFALRGFELRDQITQDRLRAFAVNRIQTPLDMRARVVKMLLPHGQLRCQRAAFRIVNDAVEDTAKSHATILLKMRQGLLNDFPAGGNRKRFRTKLPDIGRQQLSMQQEIDKITIPGSTFGGRAWVRAG